MHLSLAARSRMQHVHANGLDFAYLEQGSGPVVLMLHGFPDTAHTWSHQMPALAAAGYRVVAPFLRGYFPTAIPANGYYDKATLATDVAALIGALGGGERCTWWVRIGAPSFRMRCWRPFRSWCAARW